MKIEFLKTTLSCFLLFYGPHAFAGGQASQSSSPPSVDTSSPSMGSSGAGSSTSPNVSRSTDSRPQSNSPSRPSGQGASSSPNVDTRSSTPSRSSSTRGSSASRSRSAGGSGSSSSRAGSSSSSRSGQSLNESRASRADDGDSGNRNRARQNGNSRSLGNLDNQGGQPSSSQNSLSDGASSEEKSSSNSESEKNDESKSLSSGQGQSDSQRSAQLGNHNRDEDGARDEILAERNRKSKKKRLTIDGIEIVILENELGRSPMQVFPNTNSLEKIRKDLKSVGRNSALVYLLDRGMIIKVRANSKKLTKVKVRIRPVKYFILRSQFKGEPKGIRRDLPLIDVQGTRFIFESLDEALDFFSQPGHGQITSKGDFVPWEEHYIENRSTGEIFEFNPKKGTLKKIPLSQVPYGRNIGGEYSEDPVDLLF